MFKRLFEKFGAFFKNSKKILDHQYQTMMRGKNDHPRLASPENQQPQRGQDQASFFAQNSSIVTENCCF